MKSTQEILKTLIPIALRVLKIDTFDLQTSAQTTRSWSSIRHVQLLGSIEQTFDIEIEERDAFRLKSGQDLVTYIQARLQASTVEQ